MIFLFLILQIYAQEACIGKSDILLTVDGSGSVSCTSWCVFMDFCQNVINTLNMQTTRIAMTQFRGVNYADLREEFGFTSDRSAMTAIITNLKRGDCKTTCPGRLGGNTPFGHAIDMANNTFVQYARKDVPKFHFLFSDGDPYPTTGYCQTAGCLRPKIQQMFTDMGVFTSGVRIGTTTSDLMINTISTFPCLYFYVKSFQAVYLTPLISAIKTMTCLDLYSFEPSYGCNSKINVNGAGFLNQIQHDVSCTGCIDTCDIAMLCKIDGVEYNASIADSQHLTCNNTKLEEKTHMVSVSLDMGRTWTREDRYEETCAGESEDPPLKKCMAVADVVFVVDSSFSINDDEWSQLRDFIYNTTLELYIADGYSRVGLIEFTMKDGVGAEVVFNLTSNRTEVLKTVRNLGRFGRDSTPLHSGLARAYDMFNDFPRANAYKYALVVTDGATDSCTGLGSVDLESFANEQTCKFLYNACSSMDIYCYKSIEWCCLNDQWWRNKLHQKNVGIYTVSIGEGDATYLRDSIASYPEYSAVAESFESLQNVIENIASSTCISIIAISSTDICGANKNVIVYGSGFVASAVIYVRLVYPDGERRADMIATFLTTGSINVTLPRDMVSGTYDVSLSVGGVAWTSSKKLQYTLVCPGGEQQELPNLLPLMFGGLLVLLCLMLAGALLVLASLLLCSIKRKPMKAVKIELKVEEVLAPEPMPEPLPEPEPMPEPVGQVPSVKRSMYFIGGKAMSVDWGEKGMSWDSPFRGNNMGMGDGFGSNQKNKLYDEIQKRKVERRNKMLNENSSPPTVDRTNKPVYV